MVKAYLRYEQAGTFGVITSAATICYDSSGKLLYAPSLESVCCWNLKQGSQVACLTPTFNDTAAAEVTQIATSPDGELVAAGYSDGSVRLWSTKQYVCTTTFSGHKSAVTALRFNKDGSLLASGAKDTDVIVWDVVGEAGLFRLRGHRDQVNDLVFVDRHNVLISCSKDSYIRVWDLDTQHCCQTVTGFQGEVWSIDANPDRTRLVAGSVDADLRVFSILQAIGSNHNDDAETAATAAAADGGAQTNGVVHSVKANILTAMGAVRRQSTQRVVTLRYSCDGVFIACQAAGKQVDLFRVRSGDEVKKHQRRRKKRRKDKASKANDGDAEHNDGDVDAADDTLHKIVASDEIAPFNTIQTGSKVQSIALPPPSAARHNSKSDAATLELALALANNTLKVVSVSETAVADMHTIERQGHRSDVRAMALSSDDTMLLSTSSSGAKVWNARTGACIRDIEAGYGLCALFAPGNKHAVVGTKTGAIDVLDVGAASRLESVEAHGGAVWSFAPMPDGSGFASCSADHNIKFWEWCIIQSDDGSPPRLSITHTKTLKMTEDVLCIRISPDGRLLAAALLDCTIKVFFMDSFKFFLSLYGHKLPVLSMDISSDNTLLVSGSADKNIKIWGLDFGDCHRSLFAHSESVMSVVFVPNTHYVFTAGKDRSIKYWDVDKWEVLLELNAHFGEVWCLAVSRLGDVLYSGSHDRSLRRWERTDEPFFVEEEREKKLESLFEQEQDARDDRPTLNGENGAVEEQTSTALAGRRTAASVAAADAVIDALEIAAHESQRMADYEREKRSNAALKPPPPNPLLLGLTPSAYILRSLSSIRVTDIEQSLLVIPFTDALRLLGYMAQWLVDGSHIELTCRVTTLLLRLHHAQLAATPSARPLLLSLQRRLRGGIVRMKDMMGFNAAGIKHIRTSLQQHHDVSAADVVLPIKRQLSARQTA